VLEALRKGKPIEHTHLLQDESDIVTKRKEGLERGKKRWGEEEEEKEKYKQTAFI
jgi:hypothetical protein